MNEKQLLDVIKQAEVKEWTKLDLSRNDLIALPAEIEQLGMGEP